MPSTATTSHLRAADGHNIALHNWQAQTQTPRGIIHVCHGMAEHGRRYAGLASALVTKGWTLVAHDHRGHGDHKVNKDSPVAGDGLNGHYGDEDGWQAVTGDVGRVQAALKAAHPGLPIVLMGHSMGALIAQGYLVQGPRFWPDVLVLSGPSRDPRVKIKLLRQLVKLELWRRGPRNSSPLLNRLTFGEFARSVKRAATPFDWLSTDPSSVQGYIDDPLCGFDCSAGLWHDLSGGLLQLTAPAAFQRWPRSLPVYVFAGAEDPVGAFGKGPAALVDALRRSGLSQVEAKIYTGMRHETLHEADRASVIDDLSRWLDHQLPAAASRRVG